MKEHIQKCLAHAGIASRRQIEQWVRDGKITINGKPAILGQKIDHHDRIQIDGKPITLKADAQPTTRVLLYHKPEGEICSKSQTEFQSVFANLPRIAHGRWVAVGRLDVNTSGVLLFTNNGELANQLMHPRYKVERQYAVRVLGKVTPEMIAQLKRGINLPEVGMCHFDEVQAKPSAGSANQWFICTLKEGKYREVRQLWAALGCTVSRLIRIKYGDITLPRSLRKGKWQELTPEQVKKLHAAKD